jgi:hypothetical protein
VYRISVWLRAALHRLFPNWRPLADDSSSVEDEPWRERLEVFSAPSLNLEELGGRIDQKIIEYRSCIFYPAGWFFEQNLKD